MTDENCGYCNGTGEVACSSTHYMSCPVCCGKPIRKDRMTNEEKWERQERWETCARYIRKTGSLAEAQALAKKDGITFNTSVWITAMGKILEAKV